MYVKKKKKEKKRKKKNYLFCDFYLFKELIYQNMSFLQLFLWIFGCIFCNLCFFVRYKDGIFIWYKFDEFFLIS